MNDQWRVGTQVCRNVYDGPKGKGKMVAVMVGPIDEARELAVRVVEAVNEVRSATASCGYEHSLRACEKCGWCPHPSVSRLVDAFASTQAKLNKLHGDLELDVLARLKTTVKQWKTPARAFETFGEENDQPRRARRLAREAAYEAAAQETEVVIEALHALLSEV